MNWGTGIAIFVSLFMLFMLTLVYKCSQQNIDLVSTNYYNQEIQYQKQIDKIETTSRLNSQAEISSQDGFVIITMPECFKTSKLSGTISFFKPDDATQDFEIPIDLENNLVQKVASERLKSGRWNVRINYTDQKDTFYTEGKLNINL